jgi:hypothetical protein
MSVLRSLEAKIEGIVQGAFSRAFKSGVQPVELARKLAKEMDEHRTVSISRVYVPNRYTVFLATRDRAQFEGYETALKKELSDYLLEHARSEGLAVVTRPVVDFETDDRLREGEFGIAARTFSLPDEDGDGERGRPTGPPSGSSRMPSPPPPRHGRCSSGRASAGSSAASASSSAAAGRPTSSSTIRTSPASTPSSGTRTAAGRSPTSARRTASRSTGAAWSGPASRRGTP